MKVKRTNHNENAPIISFLEKEIRQTVGSIETNANRRK
jgi:hypothetical protein